MLLWFYDFCVKSTWLVLHRGGVKYFKSEMFLQKYMLKHKIIGFGTYLSNATKRFIVQVLLPNNIRGWGFKTLARR